ncbi:MAG TPA: hypothetical protein VKB46_02270 [Pyrinomonadaceae bacterium]|nr:hypothetical protein [Pyrinomonadaceae bacterium]
MTPEQRFDRLERIVKLMIKAGLRARTQLREQNDKITMLINLQMRNDELFARNEVRFAQLAEAQVHTDRRLDALIDIVRNGRKDRSTN